MTALAEVVVDLSGKSLGLGAELSVESSLASASDTLVVAKVERVQGVPYVTVVALAGLVGDRIVSQAYPGLPGIVTEGRYVFFRVESGPIGFVAGTATAAGAPVRALVATDGLPFVGLADVQGRFQVAAAPGSAALEATVPATSLVGAAAAEIVASQTTAQDVVLTGTVTTATVRPQDGSPAVATNTPIEIESSAPLNAATATAGNVRLLTADGTPVPTRLVLSASRKVLALVPDQALLPSTPYRIEATGLADAFGGLVSVPTTSFTTKADVAPVYDTAKLVFGLPDASGNVSLTAPPGTLAPGTEILVINATSGFVATFTAENDGAIGTVLPANFPASISDKLFVTITDPLGNVTSFTRSQYEDPATGRTAIGPGGGIVKAKNDPGFELRIPEGAVDKGVTLKLDGLTAAELAALFPDQRPDRPGATLASGLKIESADKPSFAKEVDLAFPVPQDAPDGAFFYVYRRVEGPNGKVVYQTIDEAAITGEGDARRVVTASPPFSGYIDSYAAFGVSPVGAFALQPGIAAYGYLMWTYDALQPGAPLPGAITGKVYRAILSANGSQSLKGIAGALVAGCDAQGHPLLVRDPQSPKANVAVTGPDGTFTVWDPAYTGGVVRVSAALPGANLNEGCQDPSTDPNIKTATAYEVDPRDSNTPARLRSYRNVATVNVVFDPEAPAPKPAAIDIQVVRLEGGQRKPTTGMVPLGTPLLLVLTAENAEVRSASLDGRECLVVPDGPGKGVVDLQSDAGCAVTQPGTYSVHARALANNLEVKEATRSFLVVASGGSNNQPLPGPPAIIQTIPKANAKGVAVTVFPQVVFSEPVRAGSLVRLQETGASESLAAALLGVTPTGEVVDLGASPSAFVTSLTLQPLIGLKYRTSHELVIDQGIVDQTGQGLLPLVVPFETFGPEEVGRTEDAFGSPGIYLFDDRAYLVRNNFSGGTVRVFDITDPVEPQPIDQDPTATFGGRPIDVVGEEGTLVVATTSTNISKPSNLYVFDVSNRTATNWVGAASLSHSAQDGTVTRIQVKGGKVYAATSKKGLQVVDLARSRANFDQTAPIFSTRYWEMVRQLGTDGLGFGFDAIEDQIPLTNAQGRASYVQDLKVADLDIDGESRRFVLVTGDIPLVVVDVAVGAKYPATGSSAGDGMPVTKSGAILTLGRALAFGMLPGPNGQNRPVAVIVGDGRPGASEPVGSVLATVDLTNPADPTTLAILGLPADEVAGLNVSDLILNGETALIGLNSYDLNAGKVLTVALGNAGQSLTYTGAMVGVGGRLALSENGLLFSTARSLFGGTGEFGGVRTATLGNLALIEGTEPRVVVVGEGPRAVEAFKLRFRVIPEDFEVESARIEFRSGNSTVAMQPVSLDEGRGQLPLPFGYAFPAEGLAKPRLVVNSGTPHELVSGARTWRLEPFEVSLFGPESNKEDDETPPPLVASGETDSTHIGDAMADSKELRRRWEAPTPDEPARELLVEWRQESADSVDPATQQRSDGHFEAFVTGRKLAGTTQRVTASSGGVLLGRADVPMRPGLAASDGVQIRRPASGAGSDDIIPADGKTEVTLEIEARDAASNPVADGTPVHCSLADAEGSSSNENAYGEILDEGEALTANGIAHCTYRAGILVHLNRIVAEVDGIEQSREIATLGLRPSLSVSNPVPVVGEEVIATLEVDSFSGDVPADGTEVGWLVLGATGTKESILRNGRAVGRLRFARQGAFTVTAVVGNEHVAVDVDVVPPEQRLKIEREFGLLAGDRTTDGTVPIPRFDGSFAEAPVKAESDLRITGGVPGETVTLALGGPGGPNREPEARYLMDALPGGLVTDAYGRHPGQASVGVAVENDSDGERTGYRFAEGGSIRIAAAGVLSSPYGLHVSAQFRPGRNADGGSLIRREGSFDLAAIPESAGCRLRLRAWASGQIRTVETQAILEPDHWTEVNAGFDGGAMYLLVGEETRELALERIDPGSGDLVVGESLAGMLDDLRLFHSSGASPPLFGIVAAGGASVESLEATFDASGEAFFTVRSNGVLTPGPSVFDPEADTRAQAALRAYLVKARVYYRSQAKAGDTSFYAFSQDLATAITYLVEGLFVGSSADADLPAIVADAVWGLTPIGLAQAYTTSRDVMVALEHVREGATNVGDKLSLGAASVLILGQAVSGTRRIQKAEKAYEAGVAFNRMRKRGKAFARVARWLAQDGGAMAGRLPKTLELLSKHGDDVAGVMFDLLEHTEVGWRHMIHLERTLQNAGNSAPEIARALKATLESTSPAVLRTTLSVARTADRVTPKVISGSTRVAKALEAARVLRQTQRISVPGIARLNNLARNFPAPPDQLATTQQLLENLDDVVDDTTDGLRFVLTQLGVKRRGNVFIPDATEAVVRFAKQRGGRVSAFERNVRVPGSSRFSRQYDISYELDTGGFLDIDVKNWASFVPRRSEAWKLQKDIVIHFLDPARGNFDNLRWIVPRRVLQTDGPAIKKWMLEQFESGFVKARIPLKADRDRALQRFQSALDNGLLGSFE